MAFQVEGTAIWAGAKAHRDTWWQQTTPKQSLEKKSLTPFSHLGSTHLCSFSYPLHPQQLGLWKDILLETVGS